MVLEQRRLHPQLWAEIVEFDLDIWNYMTECLQSHRLQKWNGKPITYSRHSTMGLTNPRLFHHLADAFDEKMKLAGWC